MMDQVSGPSTAVAALPTALTSLRATSDLLSLDLRKKIRRTGFSSIPSFSSANDTAQRNTKLRPDERVGQQDFMYDLKALVPSAANATASTIVPKSSLCKVPDQPDLRRITAECISSGKR